MYNLIIGFTDGEAYANRMLESTGNAIRQYVAPYENLDVSRLVNLPTLLMPEVQDNESPQVARVGHIEDLSHAGHDYRFRFIQNQAVPAIASSRIVGAAGPLRIQEFNRHYWAVKDADLYRVLHESVLAPAPSIFRLPLEIPTEPGLVAVMMPFGAGFADVYAALKRAVAECGMQCQRADDIWINSHIMDDIINLIWRARVVIADLSAKNPNVFYETGIAHTIGREVIQITQSIDDVPFDLRPIRTIPYLHNDQGLDNLQG